MSVTFSRRSPGIGDTRGGGEGVTVMFSRIWRVLGVLCVCLSVCRWCVVRHVGWKPPTYLRRRSDSALPKPFIYMDQIPMRLRLN